MLLLSFANLPDFDARSKPPFLRSKQVYCIAFYTGFNVEFETLFESIGQVIADLWQRKGKIRVASLHSHCKLNQP